MKKIVSAILCLFMLIPLAACGVKSHEILVKTVREDVADIETRYVFDKDDVLDVVYQTMVYKDDEILKKDYDQIAALPALFGDLKLEGQTVTYYLTKDAIDNFYPDFDYEATINYLKENEIEYTEVN